LKLADEPEGIAFAHSQTYSTNAMTAHFSFEDNLSIWPKKRHNVGRFASPVVSKKRA
jgi:hypothetical protein